MHCTFSMYHTPAKHSATYLVRKDVYWSVASAGWMSCSQVLYAAKVRPLKDSGVPEIAVTTDACLVEREPLCETRWRLAEGESDPDGLESKDAEGEAARGGPRSHAFPAIVPLHLCRYSTLIPFFMTLMGLLTCLQTVRLCGFLLPILI